MNNLKCIKLNDIIYVSRPNYQFVVIDANIRKNTQETIAMQYWIQMAIYDLVTLFIVFILIYMHLGSSPIQKSLA